MIVNAADVNASIQILKDCGWNLENAVNTALEIQNSGQSSSGSSNPNPNSASSSTLQRRPSASSSASGAGQGAEDGKSGALNNTGGGSAGGAGGGASSGAGAPENWIPLNTMMASSLSFLGPVAHRVLPHWAAESQNIAPRTFTQRLKNEYSDLPNFYEGSYREACRLARNQNRSLFIYIHCPQHEDTDDFISSSLSNDTVRESLNSNFICWAGSVTQTDTYKLCQRLRVEGYPCVAVLNPHREASRIPVPLHEGLFPPEQMVNWLHEVRTKYEAEIAEARRRRNEVKQNSQLREFQDMEYIQALEADRKREEEERRQEELKAVEEMEEARRKAEAERKQKEEQQQEERRKKQKLEKRKAVLQAEPPAGPGVVLVVVRLPDGQQIKRRFREEENFGTLFDLIQTYELVTPHGDAIENWVMRSRFPNKKWDDREMTLKDAKMGRQAMFFVQEDI
eukprot:CAMPEP_0197520530 /NCGR_PEP_ID=MMETSP1318-20131121/5886_1 /TAXON_ID=552666 /ORGANISM="Partenskyella glossopodia, Strain RCC365" /LENGTH=452 /DNA_ID=CAMNT_0043072159 /DNA_START=81 /DNA_END=1439 /DNA_ORIENTATION=-